MQLRISHLAVLPRCPSFTHPLARSLSCGSPAELSQLSLLHGLQRYLCTWHGRTPHALPHCGLTVVPWRRNLLRWLLPRASQPCRSSVRATALDVATMPRLVATWNTCVHGTQQAVLLRLTSHLEHTTALQGGVAQRPRSKRAMRGSARAHLTWCAHLNSHTHLTS